MSRIFDALQKSESECSGSLSSPLSALAMDVLQIAEGQNEEMPASVPTPSPEAFPTCRAEPVKGTRLVALTDPEGLAAEKFRFLSVRLRQLQQAQGLKKLLVTSTISEEGKSVVSANLAFTLARKIARRYCCLRAT